MANCLVTRLKESVSDDSLLKVGEVRFTYEEDVNQVSDENSDLFSLRFNESTNIRVLEGGPCLANSTLSQDSTDFMSGRNNLWLAANRGTVLSIANKYAITRFFCNTEGIPVYSHQVDFFDPSLAQFVALNYYGSIDVFARYENSTLIRVMNPKSGLHITGNIKSLRNIKRLHIGTPQLPVDVSGDIKDLDISPTGLNSQLIVRSISIYGTLESLVEKICNLGYTTVASMQINIDSGQGYTAKVTLNGNPVRTAGYILQVTSEKATLRDTIDSNSTIFASFNRSTRIWTYAN